MPILLHPLLPRHEDDGRINTDASFGELWFVEITYNTDPDGNWVDEQDYTNRTLHGPFFSEDEAQAWSDAYPEDKDVKDWDIYYVNSARSLKEYKMNWWLMVLGFAIYGWGYNTGVFRSQAKVRDKSWNGKMMMLNLVLGMLGILVLILVWSEV